MAIENIVNCGSNNNYNITGTQERWLPISACCKIEVIEAARDTLARDNINYYDIFGVYLQFKIICRILYNLLYVVLV